MAARAVRTKAMPPPLRVFAELLILKGVRQLFLASFNGKAARTRVHRHVISMARITIAISMNTTQFYQKR
jgi:hypothetical protein